MITEKKGFTFIELVAVVVIIGILSILAISQYFRSVEKSRGAGAKGMLVALYRGFQTARAEDLTLGMDLTPLSSDAEWRNNIIADNPNSSTASWFSYWVYDNDNSNNGGETVCSTAPLVNTAYARRRIGTPPFTSPSVNNAKCLAIDLSSGRIVSSPEY